MKERTARPSMFALGLVLCVIAAAPTAAQQPATGVTPSPRRASSAASPATPAVPDADPARSRGGLAEPPSLPSAVSSDIERFVKQSGRDLPSATAPRAVDAGVAPAVPPPRVASMAPAARSGGSATPVPGPITVPAPSTSSATAAAASPLGTAPKIQAAPLESTDRRFPINLATALRLSDARPLIVAAAQARVWVAEAELTQAKVLWIPELNVGFDYTRHDGGGPDFNKGIMTAPSVNFFYAGAGLYGVLSAAEAIYQPLVARQVLNSRQWDVQTAKNDALLQTADAYFMVHQNRGIYAGTLYTVSRGRELVDRIASLSRDLAQPFEVDRARNVLADLEQRAASSRQQWRVQSARLTKVLRLDPRAVVEPLERDHTQITLIDPGRCLDDLMPVALTNRPELASRRALIEAAEVRIRQEKARPLLPIVLLNGYQTPGGMLLQGGIFGIGPNSSLNQWRGRDDVSIQLVWQLQNMGIGNLTRIKAQRGQESRAIVDLRETQDRVAEEVNQTHANLQSAAARVSQAERALRTGIITLNGATEGLQQTSRFGDVLTLISRPQEAVYALQLLQRAFDEYFTTVADYNRAQFELFHALGYPAAEVARLRPPGEPLPVDTERPAYLPPVGHGPPPATR